MDGTVIDRELPERTHTALFPFCGIGGGALGFQGASARLEKLGVAARFKVLGGIEYEPGTARDFERLTGAPCLAMDVRKITPALLREWFGPDAPDVVFFSPPCKGASGLLSEELAASEKYAAMNELAIVWLELMFAAWPEGPRLVLMENVPRIRTRAAGTMKRVRAILRSHGYVTHDSAHNLGELGGLAQNRQRLLLVGRCTKRVPALLYQPTPMRVRSVGEVLGALPLPGDPAAGPLHRLPAIDPITALRLALIPAGGDWKDLPAQVVLPPELAAVVGKGKVSARTPFNDVYRVVRWDETAPCVTGGATPTAGGVTVADPRVSGASQYTNNHAVIGWGDPARTVAGQVQPGSGSQSVADPRPAAEGRYGNNWRVEDWNAAGHTVTGSTDVQEGAPSVADPRTGAESHPHTYGVLPWGGPAHTITGKASVGTGPFSVAEPRVETGFDGTYGVMRWEDTGGTVTGRAMPTTGSFSVADPRVTCKTRDNSAIYGVIRWGEPAGTIVGHACHDNGRFSVADPRWPRGVPFPVILSEDGTWHRPLTTLECAALQSFPVVVDGQPLTLDGKSNSAWRVRIGDAVPPDGARPIAMQMLFTLLHADAGVFALSAGGAVWVDGPTREAVLQ